MKRPRTVKSDQTLISIIEALRELEGATVTEVASELDLAKSTVHSHLATLEEHGFVRKSDDRVYEIGYRFLDLGIWSRNRTDLFQVAKPKLDRLARDIDQKAWCMVERHGKAMYMYGAAGRDPIKTDARVGGTIDLHSIAAGKAILANLPEERREEILGSGPLKRYTKHTITDVDEMKAQLEEVRETGVAYNYEEALLGLNAVGVPIIDPDEGVHGAISTSGPANLMRPKRMEEELTDILLGMANEIEINIRHM